MAEKCLVTLANGASTVLVYSETLKDFYKSDFYNYLEDEGFTCDVPLEDYHCGWVFVNLYRKVYRLGIPNVRVTPVVCEHAITVSEFKTIHQIYKKYEGKDTFTFHSERFDTAE